MRKKLIWGGVALLALTPGAAYFAAHHHESLLGGLTVTTGRAGARMNPFALVNRVAEAQRPAPPCCQAAPEWEPADELPVAEAPGRHDDGPAEAAEPVEPAAQPEEPAEVIRIDGMHAAVAEAVRMLRREEARGEAEPKPEAVDPEPFRAALERELAELEQAANAEPNEAHVFMPYADDDECCEEGCEKNARGGFWAMVVRLCLWPLHGGPAPAVEAEAAPQEAEAGAAEEQEQPAEVERLIVPARHHHDHGCPHQGCPYPYRTPPRATYPPAVAPQRDAAEEQEPRPAQKRRKSRTTDAEEPAPRSQAAPAPAGVQPTSGVDTTEYRPSDGDERAYVDRRF
jgi:hypothetical protein